MTCIQFVSSHLEKLPSLQNCPVLDAVSQTDFMKIGEKRHLGLSCALSHISEKCINTSEEFLFLQSVYVTLDYLCTINVTCGHYINPCDQVSLGHLINLYMPGISYIDQFVSCAIY